MFANAKEFKKSEGIISNEAFKNYESDGYNSRSEAEDEMSDSSEE